MGKCSCDKCVEEKFEHERLRILMKLTPPELHLINKDVAQQKILWMSIGLALGIVLGMIIMTGIMVI